MQEPKRPYPPYSGEYEEKIERRYIYRFTESFQEDDGWDDDEEKEPEPEIPVEDVTLEWLLSKVPPGITAAQIKIEFGYNASSMAFEDHYVRFYYEEVIPARKAEYEAALEQYKKDLKHYEHSVVVYKEFCRQEEIRKTEEKLAKLKAPQ